MKETSKLRQERLWDSGYKYYSFLLQLACCGSSGYNDWQYSRYYNDATYALERGPDVVPLSCCYDTNDQKCNDGTNQVVQNATKLFQQVSLTTAVP